MISTMLMCVCVYENRSHIKRAPYFDEGNDDNTEEEEDPREYCDGLNLYVQYSDAIPSDTMSLA